MAVVVIGPIPWGHSGLLCHALSLSLLSWTSMCRRRTTVPLATPGEAARSCEWAQHFSNASCCIIIFLNKKNCAMHRKKQASWNGRYSFTELLCSRMALKRWIRTDSRCWNNKLVSLSSSDWVESLRPSLDRKSQPDSLENVTDLTSVYYYLNNYYVHLVF